MSLDSDSAPSLSDLLKKLQISADYTRIDVHSVLDEILRLVKSDKELPLEDQGHIVFASSPFAIDFPVQPENLPAEHEKNTLDNWVTPEARQSAQGIILLLSRHEQYNNFTFRYLELLALPMFSSPSRQLLEQVLAYNLKPIFKSNPHPHLHSNTGRKLARAAGGPMAMQDYYDGQRWKEYPGIGKVCFWCVCHVQVRLRRVWVCNLSIFF